MTQWIVPSSEARACRRRDRGFTLIEILIVVVILGILATVVIPQFSNASNQARENTLKDEMRYLRTQIVVFMAQHRDCPPGYPGGDKSEMATEQDFIEQLIHYTNEACDVSKTSSSAHRLGPYLSRMPFNPINGKSSVKIVTDSSEMTPDGSTGWIYNPLTQEIVANLTGADTNGIIYATY